MQENPKNRKDMIPLSIQINYEGKLEIPGSKLAKSTQVQNCTRTS